MTISKKKILSEFMKNDKILNINYTNNNEIIEGFNNSISLFHRFLSLLEGGDEIIASRKLRDAGNKLYNVCDWSYKNYLYRRYGELSSSGVITQSECKFLRNRLNTRDCDFKYLIHEMNRIAKPSPSDLGLNFSNISRNAYDVNNGPKHYAKVSNPEGFISAMGEVRQIIKEYVDKNAELLRLNDTQYGDENVWYELDQDCDSFDETNSYILITGSMTGIEKSLAKNMFSIKWDLIIDFDILSDNNGLASLYYDTKKINPLFKDLSRENMRNKIISITTPYWLMAFGYSDIPESIADNKNWLNKYGKNFYSFMDQFHSVYSKPAKVIIMFENEKIIQRITDEINAVYDNGENVDFFVLSNDSTFNNIDLENFKNIPLTVNSFLAQINHIPIESDESEINGYFVPKAEADGKGLEVDFYARLLDSFEVVFKGIEKSESEDIIKTSREEFYKGTSSISWYGLKNHFDIKRDDYEDIRESILIDLKEKARLLRAIDYEPGVGGTTLTRRLAWDFHNDYPTLILREYIDGHTDKQVFALYNRCKLSILILVDSNEITSYDAQRLHGDLKKYDFPCVILYIRRKNSSSENNIKSNRMLRKLSREERIDMMERLRPFSKESIRLKELERICQNSNGSDENTPFIMSMYLFEEDFNGIKQYIYNFLKDLKKEQKKILVYIALADYANTYIDSQFFANLFEDNIDNGFIFEKNGPFKSLVNRVKKGGPKDYFKIRYQQFAKEILIQVSSGHDGARIVFSNLLEYILSFIQDSRPNKYTNNRDTVELLRSLFITRSEEDVIRQKFSALIEQLMQESRGNGIREKDDHSIVGIIFKKLAEVYSDEPHFLAHLARYYYYIEGDYDKGIDKMDEAILASDGTDSLLYHMKGMGYTARIINKLIPEIKKHHYNKEVDDRENKILLLKEETKRACEMFEKVRKMNSSIAGYVTDINLCIAIVDMGKKITECVSTEEFVEKNHDSWYMTFYDRACTLFEDCKKHSEEKDNRMMREVESNLNGMLDEIEKTISIWENYIDKSLPSERPKLRRLLARAYEKNIKIKGINHIEQKEIERILSLMQDNILDEPDKPENIRIWFNAIRLLKTDKSENILDDAIVKLNSWIYNTGAIEAYYYRFILKFLKAIEGSSAAESELPTLVRELKSKSMDLQNKTTIFEWLGRAGENLERLINDREYYFSNKDGISEEKLLMLTGRISDDYVNDNHAYISLFGLKIFFNPSATKGEIDRSKVKQKVSFCLGFSYDGPRAFNNSVNLITNEDNDDVNLEVLGRLEYGTIVKCEVIKNLEYYVRVRIIGFECIGSIDIGNLVGKYSKNNRPQIGYVFDGMVLHRKYDSRTNSEVWNLTMDINHKQLEVDTRTSFQKQLEKIKNEMN